MSTVLLVLFIIYLVVSIVDAIYLKNIKKNLEKIVFSDGVSATDFIRETYLKYGEDIENNEEDMFKLVSIAFLPVVNLIIMIAWIGAIVDLKDHEDEIKPFIELRIKQAVEEKRLKEELNKD